MHFHCIRTVYSKLETMSPTDYRYYEEKGWIRKEAKYFYNDVKESFFKERIARIMAWIMGRKIDKALAKAT